MSAPSKTRNPSDSVSPESHWYTPRSEEQPSHEMIVSLTRAIQETCAQLGPDATVEQLQECLARAGIQVTPAIIRKVQAQIETGRPNPSELVKTQADRVPPPRHTDQ